MKKNNSKCDIVLASISMLIFIIGFVIIELRFRWSLNQFGIILIMLNLLADPSWV